MSDEPIFDAVVIDGTRDLANVAAALDARGLQWCLIGGAAVDDYAPPTIYTNCLDAATDGEPGFSLSDLAEKGFRVQVDAPAQIASVTRPGSGHRLRVRLHFAARFALMPRRATRRVILGRTLPVASLSDVVAALLWQRADGGMREQTEAEMHLFRLSEQHADTVDAILPADLRARAEADRARNLAYPDGDGWGEA